MDLNFVEHTPTITNHLRKFIFVVSVFIFIATIIFHVGIFDNFSFSSDEAPLIALSVPTLDEALVVQGGDIVIPPPFPTPVLREGASSTPPHSMTAQSILVKDKASGVTLYQRDIYSTRPLASITKLMSALVLLERDISWTSTTVATSDNVFDTFIAPSNTYGITDLWQAALVGSSNQALLTLVDAVYPEGRVAFVARMNEKVRELGMADTIFVDPTGLDENSISNASDVALLLSEALRSETIQNVLTTSELNIATAEGKYSKHIWNTNWLLLRWIPHSLVSLLGGKTGYVPAAGYNFAMEVANKEGNVLQVVILGAETHEARFTEARDIAQWVFESYEWE